jgi:Mce-associated membrane protein
MNVSDLPQAASVVDLADRAREGGATSADAKTSVTDDGPRHAAPADMAGSRRRWLRCPRRGTVAVGVTIALIGALLGVSGYMAWDHYRINAERQRCLEFDAAARQGVVVLTSLDFAKPQEGVQRIIDRATGSFRDDFEARADDFTKAVQESGVVTQGTVNASAVESMTDDSAVVLLAATSQVVSNDNRAQPDPRIWRLSVTMQKTGDQIKMSRVAFVS